MKKLISAIITIALLLALVTVGVHAEEPKNYLPASAKWEKGYAAHIEEKDNVLNATLTTNSWSSPTISVFDGIKAALGDNDEVEVVISFQAKIQYLSDADVDSSTAKVILRGEKGISVSNDDWADAYDEALDGEDPVFAHSNGNLLKYLCSSDVDISADEWTTIQTDPLYLTKGQIECAAIKDWKLCLDKISDIDKVDYLFIKDLAIYLSEDAPEIEDDETVEDPDTNQGENNGEGEAKPTATPTAKPTAKPTEAPTQAPTQAPTEASTPTVEPAETTDNSDMVGLIIAIVVLVAVIGIGAVTVVVVLKKKKQN